MSTSASHGTQLTPHPPVTSRADVRRRTVPLPLLEAGMVLAWSSGFIGMRLTVDHAPMVLVVFWRCALVALLLMPWVAGALRRARPAALLTQAGIGALAMTGYLAGVGKGIELGVPAGLAALMADLLPIGTAVLAMLFLGQRPSRRVWAGLLIGLLGVVLVTRDALSLGNASLWSYGLPLLGMLSLAVATLWAKRLPLADALGLLPTLWVQCTVSALVFGVWTASEGSLAPLPTVGFGISVIWTAFSTLGGYGLYWLCLRRASPTRVASLLYLSPGVTLIWGALMFGEPLSGTMALGMLVSGWGVLMMVRAERQPGALHRPSP